MGFYSCPAPFEEETADFLDSIGMAIFKMASGEITNLSFLAHVARKGKPMIVSTGMSDMEEVKLAVKTIRQNGNPELILLHCTSNYPASPASANLRAMQNLMEEFLMFNVGYSDHTQGIEIPIAAVAIGACVIEKHFTLDRKFPGPDHQASLESDELRQLVKAIRKVETALGSGEKKFTHEEINIAKVARKSLHVSRNLPEGSNSLIMRMSLPSGLVMGSRHQK